MLDGRAMESVFRDLGITHVVWLPDSALGPWEVALENSSSLKLIRVSREGEAWAIAAGLHLGGKKPLVVIQNTGLFESGDAMRNALFDLKIPLYALIGYRSYLIKDSKDSAKLFTEPLLKAWGLDYQIVETDQDLVQLADHYRKTQAEGKPGVTLIAEGRM